MAREQILIVEDEASVSELVERVLQRVGFSVMAVVQSGEEALARVAERRPDLVLMDVNIEGGMDGIELAGMLQERYAVPVIFLTGQTDKATLERVRATNSFAYLVKPFRFEELIASVEFALAKSREARTLRDTERSLSAAVKAIGDAVILTHPDGWLRFANPAAEQLLGAPSRTLVGRPLAEALRLRSGGTPINLHLWLGALRRDQGAILLPADAALELTDGTLLPVEGSAAIVEDGQGGFAGLVLAIRDISRRRRAEAAAAYSREELRRLAAHLQTAREEERMGIAREIHDELGQLLTGFKIDLVWLEKRLKEEPDVERRAPLLAKVDSILGVVRDMVGSVRRISAELRPPVLDDGGLPAALEWLTKDFEKRSGVTCQLDFVVEASLLNEAMATALFRIVQESLTNVTRHAAATRVQVEIWDEEGCLFLRVQDNGRGIRDTDPKRERSFGVIGMRERALLLGGDFEITGRPEGGTMVLVRVPLEPVACETTEHYDTSTHRR